MHTTCTCTFQSKSWPHTIKLQSFSKPKSTLYKSIFYPFKLAFFIVNFRKRYPPFPFSRKKIYMHDIFQCLVYSSWQKLWGPEWSFLRLTRKTVQFLFKSKNKLLMNLHSYALLKYNYDFSNNCCIFPQIMKTSLLYCDLSSVALI